MMIHNIKYSRKPGIPPGINAIRNASLNQNALIPKKSARPPHIPAKMRFDLDLCRDFFSFTDICTSKKYMSTNIYVWFFK
jgi:hypothetical protein